MAADLGRRVGRAVVWSGINTVFSRIVNVVITAVVVHLVTPHQFGTFAVALTVYTVISGFSELGMSAILARKDLDPDEIGPTVSALSLLTGTAMAVGLFVFAGPLASLLGAPDAESSLRIMSMGVFLIGVFTVPVGLLTRDFRQDALLVSTVVSTVPNNVLLVLLAATGHGATAFAWSRVAGHVVMGAIIMYYARKNYWPRIDRAQLRTVAGFGFNFGGANLVRFTLLNADYLFISRLLGPTALGLYTLAFQVGQWSTSVLSSMINNVAMPALSHDAHDPVRMKSSLRHAIVLVSLIAFPVAGFVAVLSTPIVLTLYGERWLAAATVLAVLSVYGALFVMTLLLGNVLVAEGRSGKLLVLQLVWLVVLVPAMALGVRVDGLRGAALAHIVTICVVVIPTHLVAIRRWIPGAGTLMLRSCAMPFLLTLVACAAGWGVAATLHAELARLLLGGAAASVVYLLLTVPLLRRYLPLRVAGRLDSHAYDATVGRVVAPLMAVHQAWAGEPADARREEELEPEVGADPAPARAD